MNKASDLTVSGLVNKYYMNHLELRLKSGVLLNMFVKPMSLD